MAALQHALDDSTLTGLTTLAPILSIAGERILFPAAPTGERAICAGVRPMPSAVGPIAATGAVLPDSDYRRVFAYDTASRRYQRSTDTSGPDSGVRFLLYAVDTLAQRPLLPLTPNGSLDLVDHSVAQGPDSLGGLVSSLDSPRVGYAATPVGTRSSYRQLVTGTVTSGGRTFTFRDSTTRTGSQLTVDATVVDSVGGTRLSLAVARLILDQFDYFYSLDFSFTHDTETVRLQGNNNAYCQLTTIGVTVTVNGGAFASVTNGTSANSPAISRADSQPLTAAQEAAIRDLLRGQRRLFDVLEALSSPVALALPP
jgi:hypothetical protein